MWSGINLERPSEEPVGNGEDVGLKGPHHCLRSTKDIGYHGLPKWPGATVTKRPIRPHGSS